MRSMPFIELCYCTNMIMSLQYAYQDDERVPVWPTEDG